MKINKVTDIAIKPTAEKILASMQAQLDNPKTKQKWDSPFKRRTGKTVWKKNSKKIKWLYILTQQQT